MRIGFRVGALLLLAALAGCATQKVSVDSTSDDFKIHVTRDPKADIYGNYLSARFAAIQHNLPDAAKFYRESLDRDPANPTLLALAFFYSTSAGDVDEAGRLAQKVAAANPDDRAARLTLAVVALRARDYNGARNNLRVSAKGPFTNLTSSIVDAWAAAGAGDADGAVADLKAASGNAGADALTAFHTALLDDFLGRTADADAAYRDALAKAGPSPRIVDAFGRFLERNGRAKEAGELYAKLVKDPALAPMAQARLDEIAAGKKPEPLVTRAQDGAAEALFGIAGSLTDQSSADISILYLRLALYLRPDIALADILLGDRLETLEKYQDAIAVYRQVDHDSPYWKLASIEIALDEARLEKSDAAIADLKSLTASAPGDIDAWTALGDAERSVEHWSDAEAAYDRAVALLLSPQKKDWPLYYSRAVSEERGHHWDAAEADLKRALELSPEEPQVLNYLGYSWVDQGRNIPQALGMLEKARQLKPFDGYIVDSVGWAYFKLGRYGDAAKTLEDAILLVPGDPTINDHLGDAFWRVGKKIDARFQWTHALAFGPDAEEKSTIEKKLKEGLLPVRAS
ncbi:MAG: tetratricopeptide repeat protein [Alphaproteobacteria bacterium]|nr:tetratricopeptide repeat protein [Alphaproteobacteria bacterium]